MVRRLNRSKPSARFSLSQWSGRPGHRGEVQTQKVTAGATFYSVIAYVEIYHESKGKSGD